MNDQATPSPSKLMSIVLFALILRVCIILISIYFGGITLNEYCQLHDGKEYRDYAAAIASHDLGKLPSETTRFYPGYPLLLSLFQFWWIEIILPALSAIVVMLLAAKVYSDEWIGAYLGIFTPSWLLYTSVNMSEGIFLMFLLAGLLFFLNGHYILTGAFWGYACLVRPTGIILLAAALFYLVFITRERFRALILASIPCILLAGWVTLSKLAWGDLWQSAHQYQVIFSYPMRSLLDGLFSPEFSSLKKAYIYCNLGLVALAAIFYLKNGIAFNDRLYMINLLWFLFAVIIYSILYENRGWLTFEIYDRMVLSFLPPIFYAIRALLPKRFWAVVLLGSASAALVVYWNLNLIAQWSTQGKFIIGG